MNSDIIVISICVLAGIALVLLFLKLVVPVIGKHKAPKKEVKEVSDKTCPICNSHLIVGEKLSSRVFRTGNTDELCHIMGCPHCWPGSHPEVERRCPVCLRVLPESGHLICRIFHHEHTNDHVHVIGCTNCHKQK